MARATYIYIIETEDGQLIPYTVKWEMIHDARSLLVKRVLRTKDSQPDYKPVEMPEGEWRP